MPKNKLGINTLLLLAAIVLWLVSIWYIWGYRQTSRQVSILQTQVADTRRTLTRMQQDYDIQGLQQQMAALGQALASKDVPFAQGDVSLNVADLIVQAAMRSGASLMGAAELSRDNAVVGGSKYLAIRYQLTLQGTLPQLQEFLRFIETSTQEKSSEFYGLRTLQEDKLKLANKGGGTWDYALDVVVYSQL